MKKNTLNPLNLPDPMAVQPHTQELFGLTRGAHTDVAAGAIGLQLRNRQSLVNPIKNHHKPIPTYAHIIIYIYYICIYIYCTFICILHIYIINWVCHLSTCGYCRLTSQDPEGGIIPWWIACHVALSKNRVPQNCDRSAVPRFAWA